MNIVKCDIVKWLHLIKLKIIKPCSFFNRCILNVITISFLFRLVASTTL